MGLLTYEFSVIGLDSIYRALAGVEARYVASCKRMEAASGRMGGAGGSARGGMSGGVYGASRAIVRDTEKLGLQVARAQEQAAVRSENRLAAIRRQSGQKWVREENARQRDMAHANERLNRETLRRQTSEARAATKAQHDFRKTIYGAGVSGAGKAIRGIGSVAMMGIGLGGVITGADAVHKAMKSEVDATVLANMAMGTDATKGMSRQQVVGMIQGAAGTEGIRTGMGKGPMLDFLREVQVKSGDIKGGVALMSHAADLAQGQGADMGDLGGMAGMLLSGLSKDPGVKNPAEVASQVLDQMFAQSKAGAIDPKILPSLIGPMLAAQRGYGGGTIVSRMGEIGAMMQLSTGTDAGGDASIAMTALKSTRAQIISHAAGSKSDLHKMGLDPFDEVYGPNGKKVGYDLKGSPLQLMAAVIEKSGGDVATLEKVFGRRGGTMIDPMRKAYMDAFLGASGGREDDKSIAAGKVAGVAGLHEVLRKSGLGAKFKGGEVQDAAQAVRETTQGKFDEAMAQLTSTLGTQLLPVAAQLAEKLTAAVPSIVAVTEAAAKLASFFLDNPFTGLGTIVAGYIGKEMAEAAIGDIIAKSLNSGAGGGIGGLSNAFGGLAISAGVLAASLVAAQIALASATIKKDNEDRAKDKAANDAAARARGDKVYANDVEQQSDSPFAIAKSVGKDLYSGKLLYNLGKDLFGGDVSHSDANDRQLIGGRGMGRHAVDEGGHTATAHAYAATRAAVALNAMSTAAEKANAALASLGGGSPAGAGKGSLPRPGANPVANRQ